ncbi:hypothetical protein THRCLA_05975 [Thraustotheca clavata]|uniref:TNase-like domain-containing protein n=1 Tax=Thraustotheca clavata TaxID=74557 RepID=A0A1V9ZQY1_9STRA|nr:hypothetical protein THRCLA_05975 [Thraustotheca clavata]
MDIETIRKEAEAQWKRINTQFGQLDVGKMAFLHDKNVQLIGAFTFGLVLGLAIPKVRAPFQRFSTVEEIPNFMFQEQRKIRAKAISVSDGDTLRVRHLPFLRGPGNMDGKLSETTMQIRLCAIDTPETPKFGNQGQPFGDEAKEYLTKILGDRKLMLTLLQKDQYARAVCLVEYGWGPFKKDASEELLKAGLANVYRQTGAVYGGKQSVYDKLEERAKNQKLKMWSQGDKFETTSEYKARIRSEKS